jgi:uroporphyrinogen decarboxylase
MVNESPNFDRVMAALNGEQPDRVPPAEIWVDQEVRDAFMGYPVRTLEDEVAFWKTAGYDFVALDNDLWSTPQIQGSITSPIEQTAQLYVGRTERGWVSEQAGIITTWEQAESYSWPKAEQLDYTNLEKIEQFLPPNMKLIVTFGHIFTAAWQLTGFENFCLMLYDDLSLVKEILRRIGDEVLKQVDKILSFDTVGAMCFQDDIAYNSGPMISIKLLREIFFPWLSEIVSMCHAHGRPLIYHTDGNATLLLPDIIQAGANAFQAIEPTSMDIVAVKHEYGNRLALMGNLDLGYTLTRGSTEEVEEAVKYLLKHVAPGGGFLLGSSNSITNYVPLENFKTVLKTTYEYGRYPITL